MSFQRINKSKSENSQKIANTSQFGSRPFAEHEQNSPPTQEDVENQGFEQDKFEATRLQLKQKFGTITPLEHERLGLVQAKMDSFWEQRRELAKAQPNLLEIMMKRNGQAAQTSEPATKVQPKLEIGQPNDQYELEADQVASEVVQQLKSPQMESPQVEPSVQREPMLEEEMQKPPVTLQRDTRPEYKELKRPSLVDRIQRTVRVIKAIKAANNLNINPEDNMVKDALKKRLDKVEMQKDEDTFQSKVNEILKMAETERKQIEDEATRQQHVLMIGAALKALAQVLENMQVNEVEHLHSLLSTEEVGNIPIVGSSKKIQKWNYMSTMAMKTRTGEKWVKEKTEQSKAAKEERKKERTATYRKMLEKVSKEDELGKDAVRLNVMIDSRAREFGKALARLRERRLLYNETPKNVTLRLPVYTEHVLRLEKAYSIVLLSAKLDMEKTLEAMEIYINIDQTKKEGEEEAAIKHRENIKRMKQLLEIMQEWQGAYRSLKEVRRVRQGVTALAVSDFDQAVNSMLTSGNQLCMMSYKVIEFANEFGKIGEW
jgi:hypothetical protein